jgi:hypothetical protein
METKEMIQNVKMENQVNETMSERYVPESALIDASIIRLQKKAEADESFLAGFVY